MPPEVTSRDLVVNPGEYAYMQDNTKGQIKTHVGPTVINQTGQEQPVVFENGKFVRAPNLERAVCASPRAAEGQYIELENPAEKGEHPGESTVSNLPTLRHGCKVNIPGPVTFALYPGQIAKVIGGHTLRSNQYLVVSVYNEDEARKNWALGVAKRAIVPAVPSAGGKKEGEPESGSTQETPPAATPPVVEKPELVVVSSMPVTTDLTLGKRYIIPGTEISFYIPPTGIEVIPDEESGSYVRDAVTLERLEFTILIDENGNKRYEKGPKVVFPKPTEEFFTDGDNNRKFKAIELNPIQGLHVKVIASYSEGGKNYEEGDELFITGKDCAIYYPRQEHSLVTYGDRMKHYAVAVPVGEGRYVMDRTAGKINTEVGPQMLLPNPIDKVIIRRVLSDKQVSLLYPGNAEALAYNRALRNLSSQDRESPDGYVSEGTFTANAMLNNSAGNMDMEALEEISTGLTRSAVAYSTQSGAYSTKSSAYSTKSVPKSKAGDAKSLSNFTRSTRFTKPRELTLDTKYDGVPVIQVWTGYAVMVVNKSGKRRVVVGPATVLLDYDETLEILTLSTGKPKTTDTLFETVYLRVKNNKVSDIITGVTTLDHVALNIKLSFRVDFEGAPEKWFEVENYVKFLCDHVRSMLKGSIRKIDIETFYKDGVAIIRDIILGPKKADATERDGLMFKEDGMRVKDVEILDIEIQDRAIKALLDEAQLNAVTGNIRLATAEKDLTIKLRNEEITQKRDDAESETKVNRLVLQKDAEEAARTVAAAQLASKLEQEVKNKEIVDAQQATAAFVHNETSKRKKVDQDIEIAYLKEKQKMTLAELKAECESVVERFKSVQGGFIESLNALTANDTLVKIAEANSVQKLIGGEGVENVLSSVFQGTHLQGVLQRVLEQAASIRVASTQQ